jgi:hypothetical protein
MVSARFVTQGWELNVQAVPATLHSEMLIQI